MTDDEKENTLCVYYNLVCGLFLFYIILSIFLWPFSNHTKMLFLFLILQRNLFFYNCVYISCRWLGNKYNHTHTELLNSSNNNNNTLLIIHFLYKTIRTMTTVTVVFVIMNYNNNTSFFVSFWTRTCPVTSHTHPRCARAPLQSAWN